ncbi:zinc finger protein 665-like [Coregonus clupeaformis]|uniref:zinc finger protein 665-like n=1 Tax=Coregonus clupeaformis TaxID=59861 RepID=UPI001E1C65A4|nr:zinc finger protein 665-like [Coregonus clupeaformis]
MAKIELLSLFLTERLTSAAQDIYKMVEETFAEYQAEVTYVKRENAFLRKQLNANRPRKVNLKRGLRQITSIVSVAGAPPKLLQQSVQESSPSMGKEVSQTEEKKQARTSQGEEQFQESGTTESTPTPTTHCWRKDNDLGPSKTLPQIHPKPLPSLPIPHLLAQPSQPFQIAQNQAIVLSHQISPLVIQVVKKLFICKECGKTFRYMSRLKQHTRMAHTQEKPHCCTLCGKCFLTASKLKTHQLIHTGERPYLCNVCGHCFNQRSNLKVHMQRKHKGV